MSDHTRALVPLESWSYQSPSLRAAGIEVDFGLFGESLLYYDQVILNVSNQPQLASLLRWTKTHEVYDDLLALLEEGTVSFYEYSFDSAPVEYQNEYTLLNIQDSAQVAPNSFEQRVLNHRCVREVVPERTDYERLCRAFRDRVTEVKAEQFGHAIRNAEADLHDPQRLALIM
ncbi:MAG TPA: hypothetical protein VM529_20055, partial [Gemmata sp.]|nr:hypothetical protein [Gemmata sp.]